MKKFFVVISLLVSFSICRADSVSNAGDAGRWPILGDRDDHASAVRALQYLLRAKGANVVVDGRFGEQTINEVSKFQAQNHFGTRRDTVLVDARTWEALIPNLQRGTQGSAVYSLQSLLRANGLKVAIDGRFGDQTRRAVLQFQKRRDLLHGVIEPGVVERFTWCELVGGECWKGGYE